MGLTLKAYQRLEGAELVDFFQQHKAVWLKAAQSAHEFITNSFPQHARIRRDDVALALRPVLEVNRRLRTKLANDRLKQKYWVSDFTDLVIDRTWNEIHGEDDDEEESD